MTLSPDQEARTEAKEYDFELKFYVGGEYPYLPIEDISAFADYDFTAESTLDTAVDEDDTTFSLVDSSDFTTPGTGKEHSAFVHPYSTTLSWERIRYTGNSANNLTGVTRRSNVIYPIGAYHHPVGATVSQWIDVTDIVTPDFQLVWSRQNATVKWTTQLTCIQYNQEIFERKNAIVCKVRFYVNGAWSSWMVWWFGYIFDIQGAEHDHADIRPAVLSVEGLSQYIDRKEIPAHHFGKINLAKDRPVRVSSTLLDLTLARGNEYYDDPDASGENAVDSNMGSAWISEGVPKVDREQMPDLGPGLVISEVYFQRSGFGDEYLWVEIYCRDGASGSVRSNYICTMQTMHHQIDVGANISPGDGNPNNDYHRDPALGPEPRDTYIQLPDVAIQPGGFLVLCKNINNFQEWWMVLGPGDVVDWRNITFPADTGGLPGGSPNAENVSWDGVKGFLQLRGAAGWNTIVDEVYWGDIWLDWQEVPHGADGSEAREARWPHYIDGSQGSGIHNEPDNGEMWQGDAINNNTGGITQGYSIRRTAAARLASSWTVTSLPTPGAHYTFPTGEYHATDIGKIETVLESDLGANDEEAHVTGGTVGFENAGSFSIGSEPFPYTSKTGDAFFGLTIPHGAYAAGTAIAPLVGGVANRFYPVVSISIKRPQGRPYPSVFRILGSAEDAPPYPEDDLSGVGDNWQNHWTDVLVADRAAVSNTLTEDFESGFLSCRVKNPPGTVGWPSAGEIILVGKDAQGNTQSQQIAYTRKTASSFDGILPGHLFFRMADTVVYRQAQSSTSSVYTSPFTTPLRFRHYMIVVYEMSDGGRARISEIEIIGRNDEHTDGDGNTHTIPDHSIGSLVSHILVTHFGMPSSKLQIVEGGGLSLVEQDLQKDGAGRILDSMAEMSGCVLVHQLSNGARWKYDPRWVVGVTEELRYTFDRDSLESPLTLVRDTKLDVSQVEVFARNPVTGLTLHVYWPTTAQQFGRKVVLRDLIIIGNEDRAKLYAQAYYRRANFGSKITAIPLGIGEWISPTSRIAVKWSQDNSDNPFFQYRDYIVNSVSWDVRRSGAQKYIRCSVLAEESVI